MTSDDATAPPFVAIVTDVQNYPIKMVVLDARSLDVRLSLTFEEWTSFRPASAGHRLIENGFAIRDRSRGMAGWDTLEGVGYTAALISAEDIGGPPPARLEVLPDGRGILVHNGTGNTL